VVYGEQSLTNESGMTTMSAGLYDALLARIQEKKKTEKQQKVLEAAIRLFAEKGYANTSTAEIALAAGVSEGTIFKHYGSKDRLLLAIMLPFFREMLSRMAKEAVRETFSSQTTLEQFLRDFLRNRAQFLAENRDIFRVMFKELVYNNELRDELKSFAAEHLQAALLPIVNRFRMKGELGDLPAETVLDLTAAFVGGFFVTRFLFMDRAAVSGEEIEEAVRFILNGIRSRGA